MFLPAVIKIGATLFDVVEIDELTHTDGQRLDGWIHYGSSQIRLDKDMGLMRKRDVLLHEITHGFTDHAGLALTESQVEALSNFIGAVLVDNPAFVRMWLGLRPRDERVSVEPAS